MSEVKKTNVNIKGGIGVKGAVGVIGAVAGLVQAVSPMVVKVMDKPKEHSLDDDKVVIPDLYRKDFPIELEQAKILLSDSGLKYSESKMTIKDADKKYKDCFNNQVIISSPKQGVAVNKGTTIYLKYITQDVIDASQKIFEDEEKLKIEIKEKKAILKQEHKEQRKEKVSDIANKAKEKVNHIFKKGDNKDE